MISYLKVCRGPEAGKQYSLSKGRTMHIGRGLTCEILLSDPVSSRFHAVLYYEDDDWHVRDSSSRNGTEVNGQKVDHARLLDSSIIRIGDTELQLVQIEEETAGLSETQTVQIDMLDVDRTFMPEDIPPAARGGIAPPGQLLDLYTLSLAMMRGEDPGLVVSTVLELTHDRTGADVAAISLVTNDEHPHLCQSLPPEPNENIKLSRAAVKRVIGKRDVVWFRERDLIESEAARKQFKCETFREAIFVPMMYGDECVGVMHLYRKESTFTGEHFDLTIAACRLAAAGLRQSESRLQLQSRLQRDQDKNAIAEELIGDHSAMQKLKHRIGRVGPAGGCVLIRGESGSGKELVARAVHRSSQRSRRPMLTVNCAAIPPNLIESQLFGHVKGSFTGAERDHAGWFAQADGGTLFLDEIGELPLEGQAKLLRILEGHPFLPVGAIEEVLVDVRVIVATHRDLAAAVREKTFREDLYYRLSVFELNVPPLRDRGEDVANLAKHFFAHFRSQHGRLNLQLASEALDRLVDYPWPGNVRQLRNVIDSAVVMADDPAVTVDDLGLRDAGMSRLETLRIDVWEERLIRKALAKTNGSVPEAAMLLGISRATAYRKIQDYGVER